MVKVVLKISMIEKLNNGLLSHVVTKKELPLGGKIKIYGSKNKKSNVHIASLVAIGTAPIFIDPRNDIIKYTEPRGILMDGVEKPIYKCLGFDSRSEAINHYTKKTKNNPNAIFDGYYGFLVKCASNKKELTVYKKQRFNDAYEL